MSGCFETVFEEQSLRYKRIYIDLPHGKVCCIKSSDDMLDE